MGLLEAKFAKENSLINTELVHQHKNNLFVWSSLSPELNLDKNSKSELQIE